MNRRTEPAPWRRVPLAWSNLTHDRRHLALCVAGVGFAVVLMFVQYGFRNALLDSNTLLIDHFNADLVLVSRLRTTLMIPETIDRHRVAQAAGVSAVRSTHPLYLETRVTMLQSAPTAEGSHEPRRPIRVVGIDPDAFLLNFPALDPAPNAPGSCVQELKLADRVLFDAECKRQMEQHQLPIYGPLVPGSRTELAGHEVWVAGTFDMGSDFGADGTLIVSTDTFERLLRRPFPQFGMLDQVDVGLVRLEPGADRLAVRDALRALFTAGDVDVLTIDEMAARERQYWLDSTPIGFVFGFGVFMGFLVGTMICYQILSSDVADHIAEYATLKAIGYPNRFINGVVLQQALLLALGGFLPGLLVSAVIYRALVWLTDLPLRLTPGRIGLILGLTVAMCVASGLLALRKVRTVDPAEVF
jgi:putative ABC transport system permease protein